MKLLLVGILAAHTQALKNSDEFLCDWSPDIERAQALMNLYEYDCVLIGIAGNEAYTWFWLQEMNNENKNEGIICVSDKDLIADRLKAFELGADDYFTLPMHDLEMSARIKSVVRRKRFHTSSKVYMGNLVIDLYNRKIGVWDQTLALTKTEYDLLLYLCAQRKRVVAKEALAEYLWGQKVDDLDSYNLLFAHLKNLRKKLLLAKAGIEIKNIYKMGYQIIET